MGRRIENAYFLFLPLLAVSVLIYIVIAVRFIDYPGISDDEVRNVGRAVNVQLAGPSGDSDRDYIGIDWYEPRIGPLVFPGMWFPYRGGILSYLAIRVFSVFGLSVASMRGLAVVISLAALLLCTLFTGYAFGKREMILFPALLLLYPPFVINSRLGLWTDMALIWFYSGAIGLLMLRFIRGGGLIAGISIFFLSGIACYDFALFFFLAAPVLAMAFFSGAAKRLNPVLKLLMPAAFATGFLPVILYYLNNPKQFIERLSVPAHEAVSFIGKISEFFVALAGDRVLIGAPLWQLPVFIFPAAVLAYLVRSAAVRMKDRNFEGVCIVILTFALSLTLIFPRIFYNHYLLLLPLLVMLGTVAIVRLIRNFRLIAIFSGLLLVVFLNINHSYFSRYMTSGDASDFWPPNSVQRHLAAYLSSAGIHSPFTPVNEIPPIAIIHSGGRVLPREIPDANSLQAGDFFITYGQEYLRKEYLSRMDEIRFGLEKSRKKLRMVYSIPSMAQNRDPVYIIYRVDPVE